MPTWAVCKGVASLPPCQTLNRTHRSEVVLRELLEVSKESLRVAQEGIPALRKEVADEMLRPGA